MDNGWLKNDWNRLKHEAQREWGRLTEEDLDLIGGERTRLVGTVQRRYGVDRENAERQVRDWKGRHEPAPRPI